jgi:hypothetical protein
MQKISKFKNFLLAGLMGLSLSSNADYTVKMFVDGVKLTNATAPVIGEDGDLTDQSGGDAGAFTYTVSAKSGYNHSSFILNVTSNESSCYSITQATIIGSSPVEYCGGAFPHSTNLNVSTALPGVYNFVLKALDSSGGAVVKTYNFNIEILEMPVYGDDRLKYSFHKKIINDGESFSLTILSSSYECFDIINNDTWTNIRTSCAGSASLPYVTTISSITDMTATNGGLNLQIYGYSPSVSPFGNYYRLTVALNDGEQTPIIGGVELTMGTPASGTGFSSPFYGTSDRYENWYDYSIAKAHQYKIDVPSSGYSTGWLDVDYYSTVIKQYYQIGIMESITSGSQEVIISGKHGSNIVSMSQNINLAPSVINSVQFNLCNPAVSTCYGNGKTITAGGSGYIGSLTFKANNTDCMSIQSNEDPAYAVAVTKCHNDGMTPNAIFSVNYPNHDAVGKTAKVYNYNYKAIRLNKIGVPGQEVNGVFPVTISY